MAIHMFRSDEWIDICLVLFLLDTNLKKYLQGPISPTCQATFPVVSHVFTNDKISRYSKDTKNTSIVFAV